MIGDRGKKRKYIFTGNGCKSEHEPITFCSTCVFLDDCEFREENKNGKANQARDYSIYGRYVRNRVVGRDDNC